jgi:hypothetical protein
MRLTGWLQLRRLIKPSAISCTCGETQWFATCGREFGLWHLTLHGFGFHFSVIGPFRLVRATVSRQACAR